VQLTSATYKCNLQVQLTSATYKCNLQVQLTSATYKCNLQLQLTIATYKCNLANFGAQFCATLQTDHDPSKCDVLNYFSDQNKKKLGNFFVGLRMDNVGIYYCHLDTFKSIWCIL
jgi:hypothetical protein